jgi:hypothetical protein
LLVCFTIALFSLYLPHCVHFLPSPSLPSCHTTRILLISQGPGKNDAPQFWRQNCYWSIPSVFLQMISYVCIYVYVHIYIYIYTYINTHTHTHTYNR